ncbi:MAG: trypsin-like peptidase domain-containing protein [bacterium]|nr:trypsin-like peptidase domain-containing protein [bacterium]
MRTRTIVYGLIVVLAAASAWGGYRVYTLSQSVSNLKQSITVLDSQVASVGHVESSAATSDAETERPQQAAARTQDQQLQDAVARVTPAVVSIVENKEVAVVQVFYENPFESDSFFKDSGLQIPVYREVGTTTRKVSAGTGFLVRASGYIATNNHVVPDTNATYTILLANGKRMAGTVVWRSLSEDIAIVKIAGSGYPIIPLGDSESLNLAESVFVVGNALGEYNNSVSVGIVSGLKRNIVAATSDGGSETLNNVIQTDAAINPGSSGGPLVNLAGQAVGVNIAMVRGSQNIGFAVSINEVRRALANLGI